MRRAQVALCRVELALGEEDALADVGAAEVGAPEIGAGEVGQPKVSAPQVGPDQAGAPPGGSRGPRRTNTMRVKGSRMSLKTSMLTRKPAIRKRIPSSSPTKNALVAPKRA